MRNKINFILGKFIPILTPVGLVLGIIFGEPLLFLERTVPWVFAFMTFVGSLNMDFSTFNGTLKNPKPIAVILLMLRLIMPVIALIIGNLLFSNDPYTRTGLLLFSLIPVGISSALWIDIFKGNGALALSIIVIDTIVSPFVLPLSLLLLVGASVQLDTWGMMINLLQMVVVPSILGMAINQISKGELPKKWSHTLSPLSKIAMLYVILINGASVSEHFKQIEPQLILVMTVVFLLANLGYAIALKIAKFLKFNREDTVAIVLSSGMRNNSTGIVLAVTHFAPATAIPVISGILFQATLAAVYGKKTLASFKQK